MNTSILCEGCKQEMLLVSPAAQIVQNNNEENTYENMACYMCITDNCSEKGIVKKVKVEQL